MVGSDRASQIEQSDHSDENLPDNGSEPEEGQVRNSEHVFRSERAGRRVYRQIANTEQSLGNKLDALISLMQTYVQLKTGQTTLPFSAPGQPTSVQLAHGQPVPTQPAPTQSAPTQLDPAPLAPAQPTPPASPTLPTQDIRFQSPVCKKWKG